MRNDLNHKTSRAAEALTSLEQLLPPQWGLEYSPGTRPRVAIVGPNGESARFALMYQSASSAPATLVLSALRDRARNTGLPVLFASDYIGPTLRRALTDEGLSFVDSTGWALLTSSDPLILLTGQGAARSPRVRTTTAVTRLNGVASNRIIRELTTDNPPRGVREIATLADVSPGSVSKLLPTLSTEGIIERDDHGRLLAVNRRALVKRWVMDYSFTNSNSQVRYVIAPRGVERTLERLSEHADLVLTGSAAARRLLPPGLTPVVPLTLLALYAEDPGEIARSGKLIDAEPATANVIIARPQDLAILPRRSNAPGGIVTAPTALVIADLLTIPGRSDAEAEQLMDALWPQEDGKDR